MRPAGLSVKQQGEICLRGWHAYKQTIRQLDRNADQPEAQTDLLGVGMFSCTKQCLKPLTVSKEPHLFQPDPVKGEHSTAIIASILQGIKRQPGKSCIP
eukprot:g17048.t1